MIRSLVGFATRTEVHDHVAEDAGRRRFLRDGTVLDDVIQFAIVTDPADIATAFGDDLVPERELAVPAVHDVAVIGFDRAAEPVLFVVLPLLEPAVTSIMLRTCRSMSKCV